MVLAASGYLSTLGTRGETRNIGGQMGLITPEPVIIGGSAHRNLNDDTSGGAVVFPDDSWGKSDIKYIGSTGFTALGTTHTFTNFSTGPDFTNKRIIIFFEMVNKSASPTSGWVYTMGSMTGMVEGGDGNPTLNMSANWHQAGSGSGGYAGTMLHVFAPTSGAIVQSCTITSVQNTQIRLHVCVYTGNYQNGNGGREVLNSNSHQYNGAVTGIATGVLTCGLGDHIFMCACTFRAAGGIAMTSPAGWQVIFNAAHSTYYSAGMWVLPNYGGSFVSALSVACNTTINGGILQCNIYR